MYFYFKTDSKLVDFSIDEDVSVAYDEGYVLTRIEKGRMDQTRSLRIDLSKFELNSENKRILKKTENLICGFQKLPYENYSWEIHKLGKEFYSKKFGDGTMSASKIKNMFTKPEEENVNGVFEYKFKGESLKVKERSLQPSTFNLTPFSVGYCLVYVNSSLLHYAYPFYDLSLDYPNLGMGMMLKAILWAKENKKKYVYLGSVVEEKSKYKLQFDGLEWFDESKKSWDNDIDGLKQKLNVGTRNVVTE